MDAKKRSRLRAKGWKVGSTSEFLGLSKEEATYLEMRLALAELLRRRRLALGRTQHEAAALLGSSQSRVAKMEAGDPSVSIDRLLRALLTLGATRRELGRAIASRRSAG